MKWVALALLAAAALIADAAPAKPLPPKDKDAKPSPKKAKVAEDLARLLNAEDTSCYTDADCDNNEICADNGMCESEETICYGDDECRGRQVCDMGRYICVDPTPSPLWTTPSPTDAPGCCYGDSYKANDKCVKATTRDRCEDMGCSFLETDDPRDCELTTTETPTTTEEPGCCGSDNNRKFEMCNAKETRATCERSNDCEWTSGGDAVCEPQVTTVAPGCCAGQSYQGAAKCLTATDAATCARISSCYWLETDDPNDCVLTTTTPAPGCCYGDSYKANDKCAKATEQGKCESNGCHWRETDDPSDCELTTTATPTTTEEPGCCDGDADHDGGAGLLRQRRGQDICHVQREAEPRQVRALEQLPLEQRRGRGVRAAIDDGAARLLLRQPRRGV